MRRVSVALCHAAIAMFAALTISAKVGVPYLGIPCAFLAFVALGTLRHSPHGAEKAPKATAFILAAPPHART